MDACRYLGALIAGAVAGRAKHELLAGSYWRWGTLHPEIEGSGYVVRSLEAALWTLHRSESFREGALLAANLGNGADTTAAVYGQLTGSIYGERGIPPECRERIALRELIVDFADRLRLAAV